MHDMISGQVVQVSMLYYLLISNCQAHQHQADRAHEMVKGFHTIRSAKARTECLMIGRSMRLLTQRSFPCCMAQSQMLKFRCVQFSRSWLCAAIGRLSGRIVPLWVVGELIHRKICVPFLNLRYVKPLAYSVMGTLPATKHSMKKER